MSDPNEDNPLARFLVSAPLYRRTEIANTEITEYANYVQSDVLLPETVKRDCVSCGAIMSWDFTTRGQSRKLNENSLNGVTYTCRNCKRTFSVWIAWAEVNGKVVFEKYGHVPKFEVNPPKQLEKSLGPYLGFWRKGMTMRHHGYGLGALVYFRRIVEGITKTLLEMLADAMGASNEPPDSVSGVRDLIDAKHPFEKKMELAAIMIPRHLRPGGANPFQAIFEIVSGGMHADTDEECCDLVDALADAMALLFAKLNSHIEEQKNFTEAAKKIEALRTKE
jgi:hypothetical protein